MPKLIQEPSRHKLHKDRKSFKKWGARPTIVRQTHKCISHYDTAGHFQRNQTIPLHKT